MSEIPNKAPVAAIDSEEWRKLSPEDQQKFCDQLNKHVNAHRVKAGKPPLKKRETGEG